MKKSRLPESHYRRKLEHQIYLAQEHPAKIYDLSDCNLKEVPKGVFSYCKVLRKYSLNLSENCLQSLDSGGNMDDLSYLGALILSNNYFKSIPSHILKLSNLKKLIIDNNKLSKFPIILTKLPNLKILNLEGNLIRIVPGEIKDFPKLENLNLSNNPINFLAPDICEIYSLEILKINLDNVKNISKDILSSGFKSVWSHLCKLQNQPHREIYDKDPNTLQSKEWRSQSDTSNYDLTYTKIGEEIEREIMEHEQNVSRFINEDRRKSLDQIKRNIQMENDMISAILSQKKDDNDRLLDAIKYEEINTNELINKIFEYNNKAKMKEELMKKIPDRSFSYEDIDSNLTRETKVEVLNSMKQLFQSTTRYPMIFGPSSNSNNPNASKDSLSLPNNQFCSFEKLRLQDIEQRLAFKQLQFEKDPQLSRLRDGIEIIEKKLKQLSIEEMNVGSLCYDTNLTNRAHLVNLLKDLQKEEANREAVLQEKIDQIEKTRNNDQKDFWIVQYQNLLDDKTQSAYEVQELLKMAGVEDWIPTFVKQEYTIDMILDLTMHDLDQLELRPHDAKTRFLNFTNEWKFNAVKSSSHCQPTAPPEPTRNDQGAVASAPPLMRDTSVDLSCNDSSVVLARKEAECCICLCVEARMLFLNCGHVCCCKQCSFTVKNCPLCRQIIIQRVNLEFSM